MQTTTMSTAKTNRRAGLKDMLEERRRGLASEVYGRIRDARTDGVTDRGEVLDLGESSEAGIQQELEYQLIQMKSEMLARIEAALERLEAGTYGDCLDCEREIPEDRLRALPFAARCRRCEERLEAAGRETAAAWPGPGMMA